MTAHIDKAVLAVLDPHQVSAMMTPKLASAGGYPFPGPQSPTAASAMSKNCFVDDNTWRLIAEHGDFDDIVVGSGFCALAYIDQAFKQNHFRKILLLERGGFWLPDHFQNLPLPFQFVRQNVSETFPWELTYETAQKERYLNGSSPFFGGRSSFWSIWSPRAIGSDFDLMNGFPSFMKDIAKDPAFYRGVDKLLHIKPANQIKDPVFDVLQARFDYYLAVINSKQNPVPLAEAAEPARLSCGGRIGQPTSSFRQFSAVGPLLEINERQDKRASQENATGKPLMVATDVVVERFEVDAVSNAARVLHTSRGPISLRGGKTKVILATGAIPATTILLNSLGDQLKDRAGTRLTAHFRSQIKGRFRPDIGGVWTGGQELPSHTTIAACHVRGHASNGLQWHTQVNGTHVPSAVFTHFRNLLRHQTGPGGLEETAPELEGIFPQGEQIDLDVLEKIAPMLEGISPDHEAALSATHLSGSDGYVIVSCSVLGELPDDTGSWVKHNNSARDVTTNVRLNLDISEKALKVWTEMEDSTFEVIKVVAANRAHDLEYWNNDTGKWEKVTPSANHVKRVTPLFHEASTLYMAEDLAQDTKASVNKTYRPYGLETGNVYVTGAALFPTAGSWNPTPTICGFAQDLAKQLLAT